MFVALKTEKRDGHDFLENARAAGAAAALVTRAVEGVALPQLVVPDSLAALQAIAAGHRLRFENPVVGITGSCGKTSTKDLLAAILGREHTLATEGNLNNQIGVPVTLARIEPGRHRYAVVEAGINQPDEMGLLSGLIQPDIGVVTMVGPAHLEMLGSLENIAREKARMVEVERTTGRRYFPESCLQYAPFRAVEASAVVLRRTRPGEPENGREQDYVYAEENRPGRPRTLVIRKGGGPTHFFELPLLSPGMVDNAALAIAVALDLGLAPAQITHGLSGWRPSRFRGEILRAGHQWFFADCYNANPASVADALRAFEQGFDPRMPRLYVLGSMNELGPEAEALHREVGGWIRPRPNDYVFLIGAHARAMLEGLKRHHPRPGSYQVFPSAEAAQAPLAQFSGAVLLKGSRSYALETLLPDNARPAELPRPESIPSSC